jgi:hypothetical protein
LSKTIRKMDKRRGPVAVYFPEYMEHDARLVERARDELAERRLSELAAAVRDHQRRAARQVVGPRPHDELLYRRLRQISGETPGRAAA